jgi:hypothetical protein
MASEIGWESSTLQMLYCIDQVVDVGYQFGLVCSITDALPMMASLFCWYNVDVCLASLLSQKIYAQSRTI